ncbi:hypothetical protein R1sor_018301 [Riccia sorocarpa]|uniref:Bulb-type lectin domain-containing protein n=1 Tax=Riccia sorocarpa TaxID=122646 RepID=A0ABD3IFJ2_9MARC
MACSTILLMIGILQMLVYTLVRGSSDSPLPQQDKIVHKFTRGVTVCTNMETGLTCTNPHGVLSLEDSRSEDSHRSIFCSETDGDYALGFERASSTSWYLSIYVYNPSNGTAGSSIWRATSVDGRHIEVPVNSSLVFLRSGNVELRDPEGGLQWTPNTWGLGVTELVFYFRHSSKSAGGNMLLYNTANQVVWQSIRSVASNEFRIGMMNRPDIVCTSGESGSINCNRPLDFPMNPTPGTGNHRNVISYNGDGKYALGLERWGDSSSFFMSIYLWNQSSGTPMGPSVWKASYGRSYVPVAVDEHASVAFRQNGAVELRDHSNKLVWTTGRMGASELGFNFDTGSLILYNREGSIVWRSGAEASSQYVTLFVNPTTDYGVPKSHYKAE